MSDFNPETATAEQLLAALASPFDPSEVKSKPAVVSGNRALAMFFVDARVVQDRLDDVMGVANWSDDYEPLPDGSVVCRLRLRINGEWITKVDVGSPSEQPDGGDRLKAAFSDSLKRAAVKWGISRYLYRVPAVWCDFDPQRKQFVRPPQIPGLKPTVATPAKPAAQSPDRQLTAAEVKQLEAALTAAGKSVESALAWQRMRKGAELQDLSLGQRDAILVALEQGKKDKAKQPAQPAGASA